MLTRTLPAPARALSGGLRVAAPRLSPHMSVPVAPRLVRAHAGDGGAGDQAKQAVRDLQQGASRGTEDVKSAAEDTRGKVKQTASDAGSQSEGALKQAKDKVSQTAKDTQAGVQDAIDGTKEKISAATDAAKDKIGAVTDNVKEGAEDLGERIQGKQ